MTIKVTPAASPAMSLPAPTSTLPDEAPTMMSAQLTQEMAQRNIPTSSPKHVLVTTLQQAAGMNPNQACHGNTKRAATTAQGRAPQNARALGQLPRPRRTEPEPAAPLHCA